MGKSATSMMMAPDFALANNHCPRHRNVMNLTIMTCCDHCCCARGKPKSPVVQLNKQLNPLVLHLYSVVVVGDDCGV